MADDRARSAVLVGTAAVLARPGSYGTVALLIVAGSSVGGRSACRSSQVA